MTILAVLAGTSLSRAQIATPVTWKTSVTVDKSGNGTMKFAASIEDGWHMYALSLPEGGPNPTTVVYDQLTGVELVGELTSDIPAKEQVDPVFSLKLGWWNAPGVTLIQNFKVTDKSGAYLIEGVVRYQGCNDQSCIPPTSEPFEFKNGEIVAEAVPAIAADSSSLSTEVPAVEKGDSEMWWKPVSFPDTMQSNTGAENIADKSWWYIFIWGFIGGLVALLTPCVWPMIPLTVSFFLKRSGSRRKSVGDALLYGGAIIVIYLLLGLAITLIFGASKLNDLATNAVFNLAFFLLLVVFAISFFGAFDIKLPSKWSNGVDSKAESTSGVISIFFMAFTLVLVSFSCTGPIIGTLLVEAASTADIAGPAIGMGAFALALAIPFALFALFPSWLKSAPRSGGWLNSVKVVLGFLELALSLKFLSVADLAYGWHILDREVFVSLWIVIFVMLGLYLLGKIRFSHDGAPLQHVSIVRFFMALISLSFAVYLVPGLWGAPLKSVSAFVPPLYTQDFNLYAGGDFKESDDFDAGMAYAQDNNRPVLIDFSGYGCVNCRKMEGAVFDTEEISTIIKENFVLIKLMVDDKQELEEPVKVEENGKTITLRTVGDKWSYLQRSKFSANSQPYYVILDNNGAALSVPYYYDENVEKFAEWLESGIKSYTEK
ncbi:MAG: thioredoxin family protein [Muribaculaceae bacterium]|nr:thioredoxin family protein [Muribaculaceae bacterium]